MWSFTTSTYARLTLAPNDKGYRAGNRFGASLSAAHAFHGGWAARAGLDAAREQPERWDGRIEEEGNLGRTDLFLSLGGSRPLAGSGSLGLSLRVPLVSKVQGPQVDLPLVVQLVLSR